MKYLLLVLVLSSCDKFPMPTKNQTPEREKLVNYKCTEKTLESVDKQFKICNQSSYFSNYCYLSSVSTFCEYVGPK